MPCARPILPAEGDQDAGQVNFRICGNKKSWHDAFVPAIKNPLPGNPWKGTKAFGGNRTHDFHAHLLSIKSLRGRK